MVRVLSASLEKVVLAYATKVSVPSHVVTPGALIAIVSTPSFVAEVTIFVVARVVVGLVTVIIGSTVSTVNDDNVSTLETFPAPSVTVIVHVA
jgi:hypothetical protein